MTHTSPVRRVRALVLALLTAAALAVGLLAVAPTARAADSAPGAAAGRYFPVSPTRVYSSVDLRSPFGPGETRTVDLSQAFTAPASAVVINLTAAYGTANSYQTVYPAGAPRPVASSLNELRGETRANSVTVAVGQGGSNQNKITLYNFGGSVHLIVDVLGFYSNGVGAPGAGTAFVPLSAPVRLFDTRHSIGALTNVYPRNTGIVTLDWGSPALNKVIRSVVMNITVTGPTGGGYLTAWNGYGARPATSTINFHTGQTIANLAIIPVRCVDSSCSTLTFSLLNAFAPSVQVIGDVQGMYATAGFPGSLTYQPVTPTRLVDTRLDQPFGPLAGWAAASTPAGAWGAVARAVNLNVTGVQPLGSTYLTVWPTGVSQPPTSSVNLARGDIAPNAVQVRLGSKGSGFRIGNASGGTNVVVDLAGTFVTDPALANSANSASAATASPAAADAGATPAGRIS